MWLRRKPKDALEQPLWWWSDRDPMTARDVLNSVAVFGRTGSGKSSGTGMAALNGIMGHRDSGMLVVCEKPEDAPVCQGIAARYGRARDVIEVSPESPHRCDILNYEAQNCGGESRNVARCLITLKEVIRGNDQKGGESADFFETANAQEIENAVEIVFAATGKVNVWDLRRFLSGQALSPKELTNEAWKDGFHCQCLKKANERPMTARQAHNCDVATDYFLSQKPLMDPRTRASVEAGVGQILHLLNTGIVRDTIATAGTVTPEHAFDRKIILVNFPQSAWGEAGVVIGAAWKYSMQRAVLRRTFKPGDAVNVIYYDEFQNGVTSQDPYYLAQSRSHGGCMFVLTQSIHSLLAKLKAHDPAMALLSNFSTKVFHACDDATAEYASKQLGKRLETFVGGSVQPQPDLLMAMMGNGAFTGSFHESYSDVLQPRELMSGLRTGGPETNYLVDAVVIRSGRPFSTRENYLRVTFGQR